MTFPTKSLSLILAAALIGGCASTQPNADGTQQDEYDKTKKGALIGAAVGAIGGLLLGGKNKGQGALIGAAVGAAAGGGIGYAMDQQAKDVAKSLNTTVSQSDVGADNIIVTQHETFVKVTFKSAMMFPTNSDTPTSTALTKIDQLTAALKKYPSSIVQVVGHTDPRGSYDYNLQLSERRARTVATAMVNQGLPNAVYARGCSFDKPLVPNNSEANMAQNRRVEIFLYQTQENVVDQCL
ncbi:OmpA family protein [Sulfurimonas sp. HSL1-6]|uniref:OmpA family protein n=1 Tax=Thiomicrolovo immobilis TaxID=3131935 RepID=UPI0031F79C88